MSRTAYLLILLAGLGLTILLLAKGHTTKAAPPAKDYQHFIFVDKK